MYSGDDDEYLHKTLDGQSAKAGSIFLEGNNSSDFSDSHNILYGHNMRNLSMFGSLKFYKSDEDYLKEHKYFQVITPNQKMRFEIFSYFDTEGGSWVYGVPYSDSDEYGVYISELLRHSYKKIDTNNEISSTDKIVTLSTCSANEMRFTIHGVLIETK
jgi:sortase B